MKNPLEIQDSAVFFEFRWVGIVKSKLLYNLRDSLCMPLQIIGENYIFTRVEKQCLGLLFSEKHLVVELSLTNQYYKLWFYISSILTETK